MGVKIICENILEESHFLSATEQEGEFWEQPEPNSDNEGAFRLLSKGTPEDFSYSGTTTSAGAGDGTTVIDTVLKAFGDDYFISGLVAITSGACSGESKSITDFARGTGTITTAAFSAQIASGVTFTLTLAFASRDFRIELIASGDAGDATFKWSHDGGNTYLGKGSLNQASWLNSKNLQDTVHFSLGAGSDYGCAVAACTNSSGNLVFFYLDDADSQKLKCKTVTKHGTVIGSEVQVLDYEPTNFGPALKTKNGNIIIYHEDSGGAAQKVSYSTNDAATWVEIFQSGLSYDQPLFGIDQLFDGSFIGVYVDSSAIYSVKSNDGFNWGSSAVVSSAANSQRFPSIRQAANGDIVCVYESDEEISAQYEIKAKIMPVGASSWGATTIDVVDYSGGISYGQDTYLYRDIDGILYCTCLKAGYRDVVMVKSEDDGQTWNSGSPIIIFDTSGMTEVFFVMIMIGSGEVFLVSYLETGINYVRSVKRGMWEAYSTNPAYCADGSWEQKLICNASIAWQGGAGIAEDKWDFEAEYYFSMKNLISGSPSKPWRSEQDNIACSLVIDLGANVRHQADGVAFFGCNLRTLSFQMNATDSWGSPSVDESVSFDMATGIVDAVNGNYIQDTSLLANYKDHELRGEYFRATSGTDSGKTWEIKDNTGSYIILETTAAHNMVATNTFVIFQKHISKTFTAALYRYIRVNITAQETAEGYYQIGEAIIGRATELSCGYETGFRLTRNQNISILTTPKGAVVAIPDGEAKNEFQFTWATAEGTRLEILSFINYLRGKNFVLIPDSADLKDCSLLKITGPVDQAHRFMDRYDISVTAREVK